MYVTIKVSPKMVEHKFTIEDLFNGYVPRVFNAPDDVAATRTRNYDFIDKRLVDKTDFFNMFAQVKKFNEKFTELESVQDKSTLYRTFYIPKRSGGMRRIDAPNHDLDYALREFKRILECVLYGTHHTCAYAYVKGRSTIDAVKKHQKNNSRWFLKLDAKSFFPNMTQEFVMRMLGEQFPFCVLFEKGDFKHEFEKALSLCFLNDGLPQGTPVSPTLTNMVMIPVDFQISKYACDHTPHLIYTRYADDICLSSDISFKWTDVQSDIENILAANKAPFRLNKKKTHYGSNSGRNWILGVMYNQNGDITVGHEKKKFLKHALHNFACDYKAGNAWDLESVQVLSGQLAYFKMVEGKVIDDLVGAYSAKEGIDIYGKIKEILKS